MAFLNTDTYHTGLYGPVSDERTDEDLAVEGALPDALAGVFAQNSPNPPFGPPQPYHWFDGDGMIHSVQIADGKATYRNRYVQTHAYTAAQAAGQIPSPGILSPFDPANHRPDRNTANTDLIWFNGSLQALWWLGGEPYALSLPDLQTHGVETLHDTLSIGVAAHPKVDPRTGELIFFDYSAYKKPYLRYGVASADGRLVHHQDIDIPLPSLFHDVAITENHTILLDMPMMWDPNKLTQGKRRVRFDPDRPARLGVLPRHGGDVRWFLAEPCYSYHTVNAWEWNNDQGDDMITLLACRIENPIPTTAHEDEPHIPRLYFLRMNPVLHRWDLNLRTGLVKETQLDDVLTEFPRMNDNFLGVKSRYAYHPTVAPRTTLSFDGVIKYDLETGGKTRFSLSDGFLCGEVVFAPRPESDVEDDGWLVMMSAHPETGESALLVLDATDVAAGPIARVPMKRRVPFGFHAEWIDEARYRS
ncbi:MAG: carotenoid oxygenase family protein [Myxococcota bacterium]